MSASERFLDTNVLLYLVSGEPAKADRAEGLIAAGGIVSVQVLNEFVSVCSRKLAMKMPEIREILAAVRACCRVEPLTISTHDLGLDLAQRFGFSIYDALIIAAAVLAQCKTLYSEDLHHGQRIDGVTIRNPFGHRS
ncbi:MAG TPA: PIN domain-containing protein [Xanthobacteraceae bacterium]